MIKSVSEEVQRQTGWFSNKRQQPLVAVMDKVEREHPVCFPLAFFKLKFRQNNTAVHDMTT